MTTIATEQHRQIERMLRAAAADHRTRLRQRPVIRGALGAIVTFLLLLSLLPVLVGPAEAPAADDAAPAPVMDLGYDPFAPAQQP